MHNASVGPEVLGQCTDPHCSCKLPESLRAGELIVYPRTWKAVIAGRELRLKPREFLLLAHLVANVNLVCTRNHLLDRLWTDDYDGNPRTIDVHIKRLREALGAHADYIQTVHSIGYRLRPVRSQEAVAS